MSILKLSPLYTVEALLTEAAQPLRWIVQGVIPRGMLLMLCAQPKTGKSYVMIDLCLAAVTGQTWLGKQVDKLAKVLYVDEENPLSVLHERFDELLRGRILSPADLGNSLMISHYGLANMRPSEKLDALSEACGVLDPELIVLDTLNRISPFVQNVQNDPAVMSEILTQLRLSCGHQRTVIIIHHLPKDPLRQDTPAGSLGGIAGSVDAWWTLKRRHGGSRTNRERIWVPQAGRVFASSDVCVMFTDRPTIDSVKLVGTWSADEPKD